MLKRIVSLLLIFISLSSMSAYADIQKGASGDDVREMQLRLQELGYLKGDADGSYWTQTVKALTAFEQANLLPILPDRVTDAALEVLFSENALSAPAVVCKAGDKSDRVREMQQCLYDWGFLDRKPNGVYSEHTAKAVAEFQNIIWSRDWAEAHAEDGIPFSESNFPTDGSSVDERIYQYFLDRDSSPFARTMQLDDEGTDVRHLQTILQRWGYLWSTPEGLYDLSTQAAVSLFQKMHALPVTGSVDEATLDKLLQGDITAFEKPRYPYRIVVDVDQQRVFVYSWDGDEYSNLFRTMICSTGIVGKKTPVGTFTKTYPQDEWHRFTKTNAWAQYSYVFKGRYMFHSILYYGTYDKDGNPKHGGVDKESLEALGTRASRGCVHLTVEDAKWIFYNIPAGTEVEVVQLTPDPKKSKSK